MISIRKAEDRGHADHGWLNSHHSFSFADYHDSAHMGFGNLRVINDDTVGPGGGFGTHSHRDMEIISYVLAGALAHQDSMGNGHEGGAHSGVIVPGDIQRMSAGTGVKHSEFNHSKVSPVHFLQIWLLPKFTGIKPDYEQISVPEAARRGRLALVASPVGASGAVTVNADARLYAGLFDGGERAELALPAGRLGYVHVARGELVVNGRQLREGDALMLSEEAGVTLEQGRNAEVLVFDLKPR